MALKEKPVVHNIDGGKIWEQKFESFNAKVFVPFTDEIGKIINYGYDAPCFLIFNDKPITDDGAILFSKKTGLLQIATKFYTSIIFINPLNFDGWKNANEGIFEQIISNVKIHQYYEDGIAILNNRFFKTNEGFAIRGAIFRTCIIASDNAADYVASHLLTKIQGDGLWGKADIAPTVCVLQNLSIMPKIERNDMPLVSVNNSEKINEFLKNNTKYSFILNNQKSNELVDLTNAFTQFIKKFIRWGWEGELSIEDDFEQMGLNEQPFITTLKTSVDNFGDDANSQRHKIGYICYYKKSLFEQKYKVPLLLCFHGGGDSAKHIAKVSNWQKVCFDHNFLLVCVENHLNTTATEIIELLDELKVKFKIDETRIYATGFSMGGCKTWDLFQEYPDYFAAMAPMDATFDVGKNLYDQKSVGFHKTGKINENVLVPLFYCGGEQTPLPELPFQAQKCFDRMNYVLKVNNCKKKYDDFKVYFTNQNEWENKIWAINGECSEKVYDESRNAILTIQYFKSFDDICYTAFASVDNQGHECRYHTCEQAWNFMKQFQRIDGKIIKS